MKRNERWDAVAVAVRARMDELALSQADLARRAGLSDALVRSFMTGKLRGEPRRPNVLKLCAALGWSPDSIDRLLEGKRPVSQRPVRERYATVEMAEAGIAQLMEVTDRLLRLEAVVVQLEEAVAQLAADG